jgi:hypothetical protein
MARAFRELDTELRDGRTLKPHTIERLEHELGEWAKSDAWQARLRSLLARLEQLEGTGEAFARLIELGANPDAIGELLSDLLADLRKPKQRINRPKLARAASRRLKDAAQQYGRLGRDAEARRRIREAFERLALTLEPVLEDYEDDPVNPEMDCLDALQDHLIETTSTYVDEEVIELLNPILEECRRPLLEVNALSMRRKRLGRFRRRPATAISQILLPRGGWLLAQPTERRRIGHLTPRS